MSNEGKDWRVPGIEVIPETVGQFTGLTDKFGKEAYDGDKCTSLSRVDTFIITWDNGAFFGRRSGGSMFRLDAFEMRDAEITGNIHTS